MKVRLGLSLTTAAVAILSAGAVAQQAQSPAASNETKKASDPNEIVCEKQEVTGSRLATKRVCMTRAQWADARSQDREEIERVQVRRGMQDK
jgi:invasion protein IalB